jgi:hypothetical protein
MQGILGRPDDDLLSSDSKRRRSRATHSRGLALIRSQGLRAETDIWVVSRGANRAGLGAPSSLRHDHSRYASSRKNPGRQPAAARTRRPAGEAGDGVGGVREPCRTAGYTDQRRSRADRRFVRTSRVVFDARPHVGYSQQVLHGEVRMNRWGCGAGTLQGFRLHTAAASRLDRSWELRGGRVAVVLFVIQTMRREHDASPCRAPYTD